MKEKISKIYGLLYINNFKDVERICLVPANNLDDAVVVGNDVLMKAEKNLVGWMIKNWTFIDISEFVNNSYKLEINTIAPKLEEIDLKEGLKTGAEKVEEDSIENRPIESYIHVLELASDKFASKVGKKEIKKVIEKIKNQYKKEKC